MAKGKWDRWGALNLDQLLIQCQTCGLTVAADEYKLPAGWHEAQDGTWHCSQCREDFPEQLGVAIPIEGGIKLFSKAIGRWVVIPD